MTEATHTVGFACEDAVDSRVVTTIVDAITVNELPWTNGLLESLRRFVDWQGDVGWSPITKYSSELARLGIKKLHGKGRGLDFQMIRGTLLIFTRAIPLPAGVVLVRDRDGRADRFESAKLAIVSQDWPFPVIVASPDPEIEAWIVAGFQPESAAEKDAVATVRQRLGFDPCLESHRLKSTSSLSRRDAKDVLTELTADDEGRIARCIARLAALNYHECGLNDFIEAARAFARAMYAK